jgi:hypothetical protein
MPGGCAGVGAQHPATGKTRALGLISVFVLMTMNACTPGSTPLVKLHGVPAGSFEAQLNEACGDPIQYPLSAGCIKLMGSAGPMLEHRNDLVMRIWRSCPEDNPCYRVITSDPACNGGSASDSCLAAQRANYSCAALRNDLVYLQRISQHPGTQTPDDNCESNKRRLTDFDQKVEDMSTRIQWYRIFAEKGY